MFLTSFDFSYNGFTVNLKKKKFEVNRTYRKFFMTILNCLVENLLSSFSEDSGEMWIWLSDYIFWNVCHFFVFDPRNLIFGIQTSII